MVQSPGVFQTVLGDGYHGDEKMGKREKRCSILRIQNFNIVIQMRLFDALEIQTIDLRIYSGMRRVGRDTCENVAVVEVLHQLIRIRMARGRILSVSTQRRLKRRRF